MKYIIMCGGQYTNWDKPRQLLMIKGETLIARTIRLLKENGAKNIFISSNNPVFNIYAPVLRHKNDYIAGNHNIYNGHWNECFYLTDEPTTYLFGDVVFSPEAIKTIIETEVKGIMLFASAPPFGKRYTKPHAEPFALKVENSAKLKESITRTNQAESLGLFNRKPIMWELWQVICGTTLNFIDYDSYVHINDYTCDVDFISDLEKIEGVM